MSKKSNKPLPNGRIRVRVYLGKIDGKQKYKEVYGHTQSEADAKADELRLMLRKGMDVIAIGDTFKEWGERWLKLKKSEVSINQYNVYRSALNHLNKYVGDAPLVKVNTVGIQECIYDLADKNPTTGKPSAKQTLKTVKIAASQIFKLAIENRVLDYNPVNAVKIPRSAPEGSRRALTAEEQKWIIETPHRAQRAAMIMMCAGLRRGELLALTWSDIDLSNGILHVNKSVERVNGKFVVKNSTKTESGMRSIDMPDVLINFLKNERRDTFYVCTNSRGNIHTESSWRRVWESYLVDLNLKYGDFSFMDNRPKSKYDPEGVPFVIPKITPHWLRHTFATTLYMSGVDYLTAKDQLGHADIETTLQVYTHLDNNYKRKSMSKMNDYYKSVGFMWGV